MCDYDQSGNGTQGGIHYTKNDWKQLFLMRSTSATRELVRGTLTAISLSSSDGISRNATAKDPVYESRKRFKEMSGSLFSVPFPSRKTCSWSHSGCFVSPWRLIAESCEVHTQSWTLKELICWNKYFARIRPTSVLVQHLCSLYILHSNIRISIIPVAPPRTTHVRYTWYEETRSSSRPLPLPTHPTLSISKISLYQGRDAKISSRPLTYVYLLLK